IANFRISKSELSVLILLGLLAIFSSYYYYSDKESLLSLGSYLFKGDAKCFYMQTFETLRRLAPYLNDRHPANNPYGIICTPGNILFTSTFVSTFGLYGFKILYILFNSLLFIFVYLLARKLLASEIIALVTALFALFNPYALSVEVLDRNVMALSISAILVYLILQHKNKIFLHGLIFGVLAGTGLRFLPLLFAIPIVILYYKERLNLKNCLVFFCAFVITFSFNLPHLYYHGFQSLGETASSLSLIKKAFTQWQRTPFLPFPNFLFYIFNVLNYFGYLVCTVILVGICNFWRKDKRLFFALSSLFFCGLFILSYQRNWIEQDKCRILISSILPLYIYFAYGLDAILAKRYSLKKCLLIIICLLAPVIFARTVSEINFKQDEGFYKRRFLYQTESFDYYSSVRGFLSGVGIFPDYGRLFDKLNLKNKRAQERIIFRNIFAEGGLLNSAKVKDIYREWAGQYPFNDKRSLASLDKDYNYVKIDFEKLAIQPANAIEQVGYSDICAIDFEAKENLFDVYYAGLNVSWQEQMLPVCVFLRKEEMEYLGELYIDLNAFIGLNKDQEGFDLVYPVSIEAQGKSKKTGLGEGIESFPLFSEQNAMIFKIPQDLKIVIRNWFINEKGVPYKVDSWCIKMNEKGNYKAQFYYNEPESYL
ncbi:MAG: hypothetical protein JW867_09215, partial [Candidatus Omnitrophica bacterium]|nr:hypothetical protein [Candidatus Omnitrophota bacterium]